jgi:hypothetical protein
MIALFRNTSLNAFTPERRAQLLEGFDSLQRHIVSSGLSSSIEYLADALHELEYEDKHHCTQLFASADILWALARDGVCIADAIGERGGFLYDFHNDAQLHEENRKQPLMGLAEMGLQYIAIQVDGVSAHHRKQAAQELVKALLEAGQNLKYAHTVKMVSTLNYYRLMLFAEIEFNPNKGDDELYYQLSCSLPLSKRTTEQNKKTFLALFDEALLHLNKNYTSIAVEMAIAEDFVQSMVYDQVASMKLNGLTNKEILQTCEFAIDSILALSPVSELNAIIFQRYMMINACLPFQDLLHEIGVNDFELSMGLELPESDTRGFTRQFVGANFNYLYGPRREDFTNALCKMLQSYGYTIDFATLCNNKAVTNTTISTMMKRENGCLVGLSKLLGQKIVPINVLTTLLNELNLSVVTPEILSSLATHCLNSVHDNSFLEGRYKRFFQQWDAQCGVKWKSLLIQRLDVDGKVTPELCALINANGQHLKDIKKPTPAIKRVLLNQDIGLDL